MTKIVERLRQNVLFVVLAVIVVALVAVSVVSYMGWQSANSEQTDLKSAQATAQVNLNIGRATYDLDALREEQAALQAGPNFPASVSPVSFSLFLAGAADRLGVRIDIVGIVSASETLAGKPYPKNGVSINVTGSATKVNACLSYLEGGPFDTVKLEALVSTPTGVKANVVVVTRP